MKYRLTIILTPQSEGGYMVTCEELPELLTQGDSVDEALENVIDAFSATLELYEDFGRSLPDSIQILDKDVMDEVPQPRFETMTPNAPFDGDSSNYWFQAIGL